MHAIAHMYNNHVHNLLHVMGLASFSRLFTAAVINKALSSLPVPLIHYSRASVLITNLYP